ncbi:hypothetical protein OE88DRAFT_461507 [Heliocybe sulcata]|uniref:Uncharacterized protein n=1 Tax=Heliocybe sulcata TaxID=5364 RepID=A0A5C3MUS8_9AGAM|nr:hypothetical protein OE88DRAFT_461507 [Heliocybe sulcata]
MLRMDNGVQPSTAVWPLSNSSLLDWFSFGFPVIPASLAVSLAGTGSLAVLDVGMLVSVDCMSNTEDQTGIPDLAWCKTPSLERALEAWRKWFARGSFELCNDALALEPGRRY